MRFVFTANSPGEVATWLAPAVRALRRRAPEAFIAACIVPCAFAAGTETDVVRRLPEVDLVLGPRQYWRIALGGRLPAELAPGPGSGRGPGPGPGSGPGSGRGPGPGPGRGPGSAQGAAWLRTGLGASRGALLYLGGDLVHALRLARRLRLPPLAYVERGSRWTRSFVELLVADEEAWNRVVRKGEDPARVQIVGNLMVDAVAPGGEPVPGAASAPHSTAATTSQPQSTTTSQPGSTPQPTTAPQSTTAGTRQSASTSQTGSTPQPTTVPQSTTTPQSTAARTPQSLDMPVDPGRPVVALFPGSRPYEIERALPFLLRALELVKGSIPDVQVLISLSAFADASALQGRPSAKLEGTTLQIRDEPGQGGWTVTTGGGLSAFAVQGAPYAVMGAADLALTLPGSNTAEMAAAGLPMVVVLPLNLAEEIPLPGAAQYVERLPFVGPRLKARLVRSMAEQMPFVAWPNRKAGRTIVPEVRGDLSAQDVADAVLALLRDAPTLASISEALRRTMGPRGAADRIAVRLLTAAGALADEPTGSGAVKAATVKAATVKEATGPGGGSS